MAERMVAHFGVDIMHIIEDEPGRLIEIDGLGPKRTAMITAAWAEQKAIKKVMVFLQGVGVSTSLAVRIFKKYGDASISVVRAEPYRLASDVWGIGFKTADTIAAAVGIARDSPERIKAGLAYTLSEAADDGHCFLPAPNLITDAAKILEVPAEMIAPRLDELAAAEGVIREAIPATVDPAAATMPATVPTPAGAVPQVPAVYLPPFHIAERSLAAALRRLLATRADRLAAPTGRAAKRLAELTGHEAATIHRLLQLRPGAHLLLVGEVDQLPSVGAGEVLRDLLTAGTLPVVRLTKIFRQAQQSGIVVNAHRINAGQPPGLTGFADFFWFSCDDGDEAGSRRALAVAVRSQGSGRRHTALDYRLRA
jgi:exodeoxyribonuclease V alpha subunit